MCPHCRQNAPLVYRGLQAHCSACGAPRPILSGSSLTFAGKPAQVGGSIAQAFGWVILGGGLFVASILGLLFGSVWTPTVGIVTFLVLAAFPTVGFFLLRRGGKALASSGEEELEARRIQALEAAAARAGGALTAADAARVIEAPPEVADALLTRLAKTRPDEFGVEVSERGDLYYTFRRGRPRLGVRIGAPPPPTRVTPSGVPIESDEEPFDASRQQRRR